jgi:hypothetical protein
MQKKAKSTRHTVLKVGKSRYSIATNILLFHFPTSIQKDPAMAPSVWRNKSLKADDFLPSPSQQTTFLNFLSYIKEQISSHNTEQQLLVKELQDVKDRKGAHQDGKTCPQCGKTGFSRLVFLLDEEIKETNTNQTKSEVPKFL